MEILVPLDDSKHAENIVEYMKDFAKKLNADIKLLHVVSLPTMIEAPIDLSHIIATYKEAGEAFIEKFKKELESENLKVTSEVKVGFSSAAQVINEEAEKGKFDLIALGARGQSLLKKIFLGSVADSVARNAPCPVLIIR
jgi:nucleotide-binding universal stress UspA family protein